MAVAFREHVLSNGLRIVAEVDDDAHSSAIGFFVKTGARDEDRELMGVSHFLEHMMFQGTERRAAADVDRDFDDIGSRHNAWTSAEMTAFHAHCMPDRLPVAEDILSDILRPSLRQEDFDSEKQVILEEIAMYADQPFWQLYEKTLEIFYGSHPLSHRVLGTPDSVTRMSRDSMMQYFENRYSADNTVVALAGSMDFEDMVDRIEANCGQWVTTGAVRSYPDLDHAPAAFTDTCDSINQQYLCMVAPSPSMQDDRRYAAGMLAHIFGHHEGSRLYWALVETGLAEEAQCQLDARDGTGEYIAWCCCSPSEAGQCEAVIRDEIDQLVDSLVEDDLLRIRSLAATAVTVAGEMPAGRMQRIGRIMAATGEYRPLEEELDQIQSVSIKDLRSVAEAFPLAPVVTGQIGPPGT